MKLPMLLSDSQAGITASLIDDAYKRIKPFVRRTPLCSSLLLDRELGFSLLVKAEILQYTGSFKYRGASNKLRYLLEKAPDCQAVVAYSSGNHGQAVAAVARQLGLGATVIMPKDAPAIKIERTEAFGAEIVFYDRLRDDREAIAHDIAKRNKAEIVPPYDDPMVIAGQGTIGIEIAEDCPFTPDIVIIPVGGGGLIAGTGLALKRAWPDCQIYCAEPEGFDDHRLSLASQDWVKAPGGQSSICDSILTPMPGRLTFPINRRLLAGGLIVNDKDVLAAMKIGVTELKMVIEPGGATALATAMKYKSDFIGKNVLVVASGGNVDQEMLIHALKA